MSKSRRGFVRTAVAFMAAAVGLSRGVEAKPVEKAAGLDSTRYTAKPRTRRRRKNQRPDKIGTAKPAFSCGYRGWPRIRPGRNR